MEKQKKGDKKLNQAQKKQEAINSLQQLLKGEAMAIHTYDTFIPETKDQEMKLAFQEIRSGHRRHLDLITRRIEELGERPEIHFNWKMKMGQWMMDAHSIVGIAPQKMVKWALKGEDMGLAVSEEVVKGDLDEVSKELVHIVFNDSRNYIDTLIEYNQE